MKTSLYIHIPFCSSKCPYCSFSVVVGQAGRESEYLDSVEREARRHAGTSLLSVYIGGGTPSALSLDGIARLSAIIDNNFTGEGIERTFELNPESVTPSKAQLLKDFGFTRMSLGAQSFHEGYLKQLGRGHAAKDVPHVFKTLRCAGFDNINVDLMFGFPGQTAMELEKDIDAALALGSEHISLYALTIDDKSVFRVRGVKVSDDGQAEFYHLICSRLKAGGLKQYEISNFARPGYESAHNLNYWQGGEYIGLGMAAHSHLNGERFWNADTFPRYLQMMQADGSAVAGREKLVPSEKMIEAFLFGLRMNQGVDLARLQIRFGCALAQEKVEELENLIEAGFLVEEGACILATDKGRLVLDEISARLI